MGEAIGLGVEVMQSTIDSWRPSAFDLQDFYSNNLGQQFYDSNFYQEYKSGDVDFSKFWITSFKIELSNNYEAIYKEVILRICSFDCRGFIYGG